MKRVLNAILSAFNTPEKESYYYVKMERNEKCYCNSGKKYKSCHFPDHHKKNRLAVRVINETTGEENIKIMSMKKLRKEYYLVKTPVK